MKRSRLKLGSTTNNLSRTRSQKKWLWSTTPLSRIATSVVSTKEEVVTEISSENLKGSATTATRWATGRKIAGLKEEVLITRRKRTPMLHPIKQQ